MVANQRTDSIVSQTKNPGQSLGPDFIFTEL
jgi:hypothetical protein